MPSPVVPTGPVLVVPLTGSQLTRGQWAFSFALVSSLFFTWGFAYGLLDVLNAHFQVIFGINKTQSTLLQLAYFGAYVVFAPIAGIFMRKKGYKAGIHLGLTLYSLGEMPFRLHLIRTKVLILLFLIGAVFFWPSAKFAKYGGFVGCTFVIGCGLASLEVAANSYIAVLGTPKYAAARLNFSQGFQGIASFAGPLIASRWFFRGANATKLDTVQWVYLAVAGLGVVLNVLFYFCNLPEIEEEAVLTQVAEGETKPKVEPFIRQYRCIFGFVAQMAYCGAQVGVASLAVNFMIEQGVGLSSSKASQLFSFCQLTFTFGRFIGVGILQFIDPALLLSLYAIACCIFSLAVSLAPGIAGIGCLFALFFFESICYPCIFTLGTKNLGIYSKQGSGLIVVGVGGGAWYPPAQASVADRVSTRRSYLVPFSGYCAVAIYAIGMVVDQAAKNGFRVRNVNEQNHIERNTSLNSSERSNSADQGEKAEEIVEVPGIIKM
ncbi:hypothetical protein D9613_000548 [Agrocybe pediades]|uniref:MFS general substrate transporter n=1 Tax=Agrocybe pediades TaxID=84607 RepID=A0A8H4R333_9AGAR|nr:hypothetical protein D9613_000548 [Agrocybe pediades]